MPPLFYLCQWGIPYCNNGKMCQISCKRIFEMFQKYSLTLLTYSKMCAIMVVSKGGCPHRGEE